MFAVIQGSEGRQTHAGFLRARNGKRVLFVADPGQAPRAADVCHARPDDASSFGGCWRQLVLGYNANPRNNPLGLLPAHALYPEEIYRRLVEELGAKQTYILSAGWGLIGAAFLTPNYDITFNPGAEPFRRRGPADCWADFCMLPGDRGEDVYVFADADHLPLFCRLTASYPGRRIVFYPSGNPPEAPGCELRKFEPAVAKNWRHECARAFLSDRPKPRAEKPVPRVANIEARLRQALKQFPQASLSLAHGEDEPEDQVILAAILRAKSDIAEYLWLMRTFREVDVRKNAEFQERFNLFYRVSQRSQAWQAAYYQLLEAAKVIGAGFADILQALWEETGRYEPAFASRLVATVDPAMPIWDRFVLMNTGFRAPSYLDPEKMERAARVYRQICDWYSSRLQSSGGQRILELFDEAVPEHPEFSALKKLEFVLWHLWAEHTTHAVPDRPRVATPAPST
jgi:hypothetical protein